MYKNNPLPEKLVLIRAAKTDVTDEWITQVEKDKKEMWVVKDYQDFLGLLKESLLAPQEPITKNPAPNRPPKRAPQ